MSKKEITSCAACKLQRRSCGSDCSLRPYFPAEEPRVMKEYEHLQRVFRPDFVRKLVESVGPPLRDDAVRSLVFEADAWKSDPVHGCLGNVTTLQNNIKMLEMELEVVQRQLQLFRCSNRGPPAPPDDHQPDSDLTIDQAAAGIGAGNVDQFQYAFTSSGEEQFATSAAAHWSEELCTTGTTTSMDQGAASMATEEEDPHRHHLELFSPRQDSYCHNN